MPLEAVIFDMDGVLVASEDYWLEARIEWAGNLGKSWTDDDQRACMGRNTIEWAEVMRERLELGDMPLDRIMTDVTGLVLKRLDAHLPVLPGAVEAVHRAASAYRVALASGSPTAVIRHVTQATGLDKVFEVMVFGDDMARGKPHPDIYLEAARQLGVAPEHCAGIEDSGNGVRALHAAGMIVIAAPSPNFPLAPDVLALADVQIASLDELTLDLLQSLGQR